MSVAQYAGTPRPPPFNWSAAQLRVVKLIAADAKEDIAAVLSPLGSSANLTRRHRVDAATFAKSDIVGRSMRLRFPRTIRGYRTGLENIISVENGSRHRIESALPGMVKAVEDASKIILEVEANTLGEKGWEKAHDDVDPVLLEKQLKSLWGAFTAIEKLLAQQQAKSSLDEIAEALGDMITSLRGDAQDARRP